MASKRRPSTIHQSHRRNYIIVWVDANVNEDNSDTKNTKSELAKVVNEIQLIAESNTCVRILKEFSGTRSFVITSGSLGQNLISLIHDIENLEAVFVFCGNKSYHKGWSENWAKIQRVETKIEPICEALTKLVHQVKNDEIAMSFIQTNENDCTTGLKKLEPSFMYTGLLKDTLLAMNFTPEHTLKMIVSFIRRYQNEPKELQILDEFNNNYHPSLAIWWYTRDCFIYNDLNRALRDLEGDIIIDMGFFIHDLHKQIEQLHLQQLPSFGSKKFILYRGQGLSIKSFEKLKKSRGSLLGFNCFLSTSLNELISLAFAEDGSRRSGHVGILFVMTIDPSLKMVPFAKIMEQSYFPREDEILFSMHSIFKIVDVQEMPNYTNIFQVSLALTSDNDSKLQGLKKYMVKQYGGWGEHSLGWILDDMGQYDKAEEIYFELLEKTTNERDIGMYYHQLGYIKDRQGKYEESIEYCEKALKIYQRILPKNDPEIGKIYHQIGSAYFNMAKHSKALENYEKSLEMRAITLPSDHPDIAQSYNNIAGVYNSIGEYSKALTNYEKSLKIYMKKLPEDHRDIATSYNNIGSVYYKMGEYAEALRNFEKSLEIYKKTLPDDHPDIGKSYNNIGGVYKNIGDFSKALTNYEKSLEILEKTLPKDHPDIAASYGNIGTAYFSMQQYSKALEYLEEAHRIRITSLPPEHPDIKKGSSWIAKVKKAMLF